MSDLERRREISFEQAEGLVPMPVQMGLGEISRATRARLWQVVFAELNIGANRNPYRLDDSVAAVLQDEWVHRRHNFADDFSNVRDDAAGDLRNVFERKSYGEVLGFVQFYLRHKHRSSNFTLSISNALIETHSAYRVFEGWTIAPISSDANAAAVQNDLRVVSEGPSPAISTHLRAAATALSGGDYAASVRESIHAVDAAARMLAPNAKELGPALTALSASGYIHGAMKNGFAALYGYASDEKGVRHALIMDAEAKVTEADALYMFGSCAAFCAYLIAKGREFGVTA